MSKLPDDYFDVPTISDGYPKNRKSSGLSRKEYMKQYREKNKDRLREYNKVCQRKYFDKNREKYIFWQAKQRAKKEGLPFDIEIEDLAIPDECPILKIPLFRNTGGKTMTGNSPSLDRIIPEKGYVKGNVQIISQRANVMKNNASIEELRRFSEWVTKQLIPSLKTSRNT